MKMRLDVALTPRDVEPGRLRDRAVVVFDVLRATTTMTAALAAGVAGIRVFESLDAAAAAANGFAEPRVLCGERQCLRPPGFDLGNSPGAFDARQHAGRTVFMSTTNGTRAIVAARSAKLLLAGALVNASAVANHLIPAGLDVTLLCAGTDGEPAMEDLLGAGAVIDALAVMRDVELQNDNARVALRMLRCCRGELRPMLADAAGGRNVIAAGLEADIDFAARLDALDVVGRVLGNPLRVVRG